jgi:predicted MFS family arabinose efflux permease
MAPAASAHRATAIIFVSHALLFASWTAHIPQLKQSLGLTNADLGFALFGAPIGSVLAMLFVGRLLDRYGSKRLVQVTLAGYCLTGFSVGLAGSQPALFATLLIWGVFHGSLDVSMNTQGVSVERARTVPIMSGLHGAWSVGGFIGAGLGALAVGVGIPLAGQLAAFAICIALVAGWSTRVLLPDPHDQRSPVDPAQPSNILRHPGILILGAVAIACMFCEGAAADWSAVYLRDSLGAQPAVAGLGYAAFAATMVIFRLTGDRLLMRFRPNVLLPILASVATLTLIGTLIVGSPLAALVGFGALGIGLALVIPTVFSIAGRLPGVQTGPAVAAVSALGWIGFVGGPPIIGLLSEHVTLPVTLALLPVLTATIAIATRFSPALRARTVSERSAC